MENLEKLWEKAEKALATSHNVKEVARKWSFDNSAIRDTVKKFLKLFREGRLSKNLWIVERKTLEGMRSRNPASAELLEIIVREIKRRLDEGEYREVFKELGFFYAEEQREVDKEQIIREREQVEILSGIIGRVAITQATPSTPYSFYVWLKDDDKVDVEPGDLLKVKLEGNNFVIAEVHTVKAESDYRNVREVFFGWSFGNPEEKFPTRIPIIRVAEAGIVYRNDGKNSPLSYFYEVYKAGREELKDAFSSLIKEENRILLGFVKDSMGNIVPVFGDYNFIFGYQAGHVNITGKSGVAGKTSYALFLMLSALTHLDDIAFVAFNVKERDLLSIGEIQFDSMEEVIEHLENSGFYHEAEMWRVFSEFGSNSVKGRKYISPLERLKSGVYFRKFEPEKDFIYGLQDLLERGISIFSSLFEQEDLDERFISLLYSIESEFSREGISFEDLKRQLSDRIRKLGETGSQKQNQYVLLDGIPHHVSTVQKFLNRLNSVLGRSRVIDGRNPRGRPVRISDIEAGELWVIDIHLLNYNEQRMVFMSVLRDLQRILELKKGGEKEMVLDGHRIDLEYFPSRVCIFVDELNRFAPASSRSGSPIKSFIVDVAARGRSIGLTLIGAEQFASQIDDEVLGNASTYLIGKTELMELSNSFYRRIPEGLRERIPFLSTGELILIHEALPTAMLIRYPRPLHHLRKT